MCVERQVNVHPTCTYTHEYECLHVYLDEYACMYVYTCEYAYRDDYAYTSEYTFMFANYTN
jgi:hypothetical protein